MGTDPHASDDVFTGGLIIGQEDDPPPPSGAQSSSGSSSSQSFEFVLVNDQGSRRQVRRHAMRQYMRQRRLDGIARLASSRAPVPGWLSSADSPVEVMVKDEPEHVEDVHCEPWKDHGTAIVPIRTRNNLSQSGSSSPVSLVSPGAGGLRDPFNSYPMPISEQDHRLINHCTPFYFFVRIVLCAFLFTDSYRCGDVPGNDVQTIQLTSEEPNDGDLPRICAEGPPPFSGHASDSLETPSQR